MTKAHLNAQARLVVSGLDAEGKSTIVSDGNASCRVAAPGFTVMDLWQVDSLPTTLDTLSALGEAPILDPPKGGFVVRVAVFPPDEEFDAAGYAESLDSFGGQDSHEGGTSAEGGVWHHTDTVDVVTVISGEVYAVMESGETLLKPGDSIVNTGTKHIWSNRTDEPCVIIATMMGAKR
jgi:mannose-6-phosphate isomerase-like protein (cupin superfamily)